VSTFSDAPVQWDVGSGEGIRWKTPVSLPGNSSPVVWQKHVFLTGATEQDRQVFAFDVDSGELLWQAAVPGTPQSTATVPEVLKETGYAAPTPVTDGRRVFAIFANGDLVAFDYQGQIAWSHSFGIPENVYGHASSLTMYHPGATAGLPGSAGSAENAGQARPLNGDAGGTSLVIVQLDQGALGKDGLSRLYALSAADGSIVWQAERDVPNSWTSPIIINHDGQDQLITAADPWVIAYDPANGDELWRVDCLRSDCGPSPVYAGGLIQIGNEYCEWSALKPDGTGNITETAVQWTALDGLPDTCCPLAAEGLVFLMPSSGYFTCLDAATGEFLWEQDFTTGFTSSPSLVKTPESEKSPDSPGLVYLFTKRGKAIIGRPTRDGWETVSECSLGEGCVTSPAFQPGRMYIRGEKHLFCIEMQ